MELAVELLLNRHHPAKIVLNDFVRKLLQHFLLESSQDEGHDFYVKCLQSLLLLFAEEKIVLFESH